MKNLSVENAISWLTGCLAFSTVVLVLGTDLGLADLSRNSPEVTSPQDVGITATGAAAEAADDDMEKAAPGKHRVLENRAGRQRRRSSFRSDLGKRNELMKEEDRRASSISSFRSDLGKRRIREESGPSENFGSFVEDFPDGIGRFKRPGDVVPGEDIDLEEPSEVERSLLSFLPSDFGRNFENEMNYRDGFSKRGRYGFRGDLGKRGRSTDGTADTGKRRYSFRGDLGRKRSATWSNRLENLSTDEAGARFQAAGGSYSDQDPTSDDYETTVEKRGYRADLG